MLRFLCPFLIGDERQIPDKLVRHYDLGLEAMCFSGSYLNDLGKVSRDLRTVCDAYPGRLKSFHFPTEEANYFDSESMQVALMDLAATCSRNGLDTIVIHSNYFEPIASFSPANLASVRARYIDLFQELDVQFQNYGVRLLIENMPVIGNNGDDFDSVFVFPDDFRGFERFTNVGIAWDFGHWVFTTALMRKMPDVYRITTHPAPDFWEFRNILPLIGHFHLSSFTELAVPGFGNRCTEGVPPQSGDFDPSLLVEALRMVAAEKTAGVSLEIFETDYRDRINLRTSLEWLKNNHLA